MVVLRKRLTSATVRLFRRRTRHVGRRNDLILGAVHLQGRVGDVEPFAEAHANLVDNLGSPLDRGLSRHRDVARQGVEARGDGPDVQIMDAADTVDG